MDSKLFWIRNKREIITAMFVLPLFIGGLFCVNGIGSTLILASMVILLLYAVGS